jgi:perosamine synthetase
VHYPQPVHRSHAYRSNAELQHTEAATRQVLSLPVHPGLSPTDLQTIAEAVNRE